MLQINKKQSAFSLIEVMLSLLLLSIGVLGTSVLLFESTQCYERAKLREKAINLAWSISEALHYSIDPEFVVVRQQYWQEKLEQALPGSILEITAEDPVLEQELKVKAACIYWVVIRFPGQDIATVDLKVHV